MCSAVVLVLRRTIFHLICWICILLFIYLRVAGQIEVFFFVQLVGEQINYFSSSKGSNCTVSITEVLFSAIPVGFLSGDDHFRLCLVHAALFPETTPRGMRLVTGRKREIQHLVCVILSASHSPPHSITPPKIYVVSLKGDGEGRGKLSSVIK